MHTHTNTHIHTHTHIPGMRALGVSTLLALIKRVREGAAAGSVAAALHPDAVLPSRLGKNEAQALREALQRASYDVQVCQKSTCVGQFLQPASCNAQLRLFIVCFR
jgi:hypothetical protein